MSYTIIDTHTHLYLPAFDEDRKEMMDRAISAGVSHFMLPNIDLSSIPSMLDMEEKYAGICYPMMGLHPCSVKEDYKATLSQMEAWHSKRSFIGVGEIGLDLFWDKTTLAWQLDALETQLEWSMELQRPVTIHTREATDEVIRVLEKKQDGRLHGVVHCFTGNVDQAKSIIDLGLSIGIGGVVTFKNGGLDKVLPEIPLSSIVLETDAPYLAPIPFRGKRNEPSYLIHIAEKVSELCQVSMKEVCDTTTSNAKRIFQNMEE